MPVMYLSALMQLEIYATIAQKLVAGYATPEPMHLYLQKYFKLNKKHGSRDRKVIANIVYATMRAGLSPSATTTEVLNAYNMQETGKSIFSFAEGAKGITRDEALWDQLCADCNKNYPFTLPTTNLSEGVNIEQYRTKLFVKPFTFLRWRSHKPLKTELAHVTLQGKMYAFLADAKLQQEQLADSDYVIQDANSQAVCEQITAAEKALVWDCCSASGGKSLALLDKQSRIKLYASDIRPQVLKAYQHRLAQYGFKAQSTFVADLSNHASELPFDENFFDHIICDVPCSGSGTWARTPENYCYSSAADVAKYSMLQVAISARAAQYLKPGGMLHYITCSVFESENEMVVKQILAGDENLELVQQKIFDGAENNSDYLFYAQLRKK
jgi:16S rRNA (cytosine967-C5)-methyltransferase